MAVETWFTARSVLHEYEQWEADLITNVEAWAPDGTATLPRIPQELWDRLIEIQGRRNQILNPLNRPTTE